jgi:hypothetical protein
MSESLSRRLDAQKNWAVNAARDENGEVDFSSALDKWNTQSAGSSGWTTGILDDAPSRSQPAPTPRPRLAEDNLLFGNNTLPSSGAPSLDPVLNLGGQGNTRTPLSRMLEADFRSTVEPFSSGNQGQRTSADADRRDTQRGMRQPTSVRELLGATSGELLQADPDATRRELNPFSPSVETESDLGNIGGWFAGPETGQPETGPGRLEQMLRQAGGSSPSSLSPVLQMQAQQPTVVRPPKRRYLEIPGRKF